MQMANSKTVSQQETMPLNNSDFNGELLHLKQ